MGKEVRQRHAEPSPSCLMMLALLISDHHRVGNIMMGKDRARAMN